MGKKVYVGNLSFSVTEQVLQSTFAQHGTVETLNNPDGRPMQVNEAKAQARRSDRERGRSGGNRW